MLCTVHKQLFCVFAAFVLLQACSTQPSGRYSQKQDSAPQFDYGQITYVEPIPVYEPYNVWTSRPYTVLGKYYTPMLSSKGYEEIGYASWYGQKFHGHTTANGEIFDMFALTAAHKTLPLPSFVRVSNLENGKVAVVRVNDRGPFHDDRILDLSYGAAKKLGFHDKGVSRVKVEIVHVAQNGVVTIGKNRSDTSMLARNTGLPLANEVQSGVADSTISQGKSTTEIREQQDKEPDLLEASLQDPLLFVQVVATSDYAKARDLGTGLSNLLQVPNSIPKVNNVYRLHLGPLETEQNAQKIIQDLKNLGFDQAFRLELRP